MVMQSCKNWKGLIGILGLCACTGLLIDPQHFLLNKQEGFSHPSFSPVFDLIDAKPKSVTAKQSLTTRPKEPDMVVDDGQPLNIQDKVRIHIQLFFFFKPQCFTLF